MTGVLQQRDIIEYEGIKYRVLSVDDFHVLVIVMESPKTVIQLIDRTELENGIWNNQVFIQDEKRDNVRYVHPDMLAGASLRIYNEYKNTSTAFLEYSDTFEWLLDKQEKALFIEKLAKENKTSLATARRRLRDYLQNGMTLRGLEAKYYNCGGRGKTRVFNKENRPGRKGLSAVVRDEKTIKIFDKMTSRYIAAQGRKSISIIYLEMLQNYYSEKMVVGEELTYTPYSISARPSKKQLYYHISKKIGGVEEYVMKNGYKRARNNIRPLRSDTICALEQQTIGDCFEMDEMETDYELVSSYDRNQVIGDAVMYLIIDVFSKMIVGYTVGIDNNSWAGAEMAFLNMAESKVMHCAQKGIKIAEKEWPVSSVLPRQILIDNGSEYISKRCESFARENGLHLKFTPAAMGSMKGNIEGEFRRFNLKTNGLLPGQIVKGAYRKPHERKARLTIEEFEKIVIRFILNHNQNPMDFYKANKEIFVSGITQTPNNIWEMYMKRSNQLKKITDMEQYRLSLLHSGRARLTREGIVFKQIIYSCDDLKWLSYEMGNAAVEKTKTLQIKFDKRCMDIIFYLTAEGTYKRAYINNKKTVNEKYQHLSYDEVLQVNQRQRRLKQSNEEIRLLNDLNYITSVKKIVKEAEKQHKGINSNDNKKQNRMETKQRLHQEYNVAMKIDENQNEMESQLEVSCVSTEHLQQTTLEQVKQNRLLALMDLTEGEDR